MQAMAPKRALLTLQEKERHLREWRKRIAWR
jgi:hypothetical protein